MINIGDDIIISTSYIEFVDEEMNDSYLQMIGDCIPKLDASYYQRGMDYMGNNLIVYTAMHGVGTDMLKRVFDKLNIPIFFL